MLGDHLHLGRPFESPKTTCPSLAPVEPLRHSQTLAPLRLKGPPFYFSGTRLTRTTTSSMSEFISLCWLVFVCVFALRVPFRLCLARFPFWWTTSPLVVARVAVWRQSRTRTSKPMPAPNQTRPAPDQFDLGHMQMIAQIGLGWPWDGANISRLRLIRR